MAANLSDNLKITKAPPVGAFALRRYDRGIREGVLHQYPCHIVALQSIFSISNARQLQCHNVEAENIEGPIPVTLNEYICLIAL